MLTIMCPTTLIFLLICLVLGFVFGSGGGRSILRGTANDFEDMFRCLWRHPMTKIVLALLAIKFLISLFH